MHLSVSLCGDDGDRLTLHLRHGSDRLLSCNVALCAGSFRGNLETELFVDELRDLQGQINRIRRDLSGTAKFSNELRGLEFTVVMNQNGRAAVEGTARDLARGGRLFFTFLTDEAYLAETVAELTDALSRLG